ncbi:MULTISPECIES: type I restriction endonuclease subunit R [Henriciella]|jgi:type I restriction enzyme, R subunit|uniref:type I restriction endonuclease subunit R n=1 Tax=Henriciella TaxID=453849 RepID=UPI00351612C9
MSIGAPKGFRDDPGKPEIVTQKRLLYILEAMGYTNLGFWKDRKNSNIEEEFLTANLKRRGYSPALISGALQKLREAANQQQANLYERNRDVWSLLVYGAGARETAQDNETSVKLIDWANPDANDFAVAEEVTLRQGDGYTRRPDLVLYINGIAVGVIELKNSRTSIAEGIRQLNSNQQPQFNEWFFSTIQFCFAGNDSEGLKYGTIGTPETYYLKWKEDEADNDGYKLDKYIAKLCEKRRFLELIRDFIVFDAGVKKVPRHNQYFGVKKAQARLVGDEGGIIWHTQGSGKSITMVMLARWILQNITGSRVAIITDRDKLDKQIVSNFENAGVDIARASSGRDLLSKLSAPSPSIIASLVHKFGRKNVDDMDKFLEGLAAEPFPVHGKLFVFVDECHRTQSGKLHKLMKAIMPDAIFVGFTGTPLLKKDKATSMEVFGSYIDTYKHNEAVEDGVVLDLVYEARDIDQRISLPGEIDKYFEAKTKTLNDWQTNELKKRWATLREVLSSESRQDQIVTDVVLDFEYKVPRLLSGQGNAILVASSIFEACRYYELFQKTKLRGKCAVVTSYDPQARDISKEDVGANTDTEKEFVFNTYTEILKNVQSVQGKSKTEVYEDRVTELFTKQPANMRLLIVVDKLLTGFDAPPCSVLYIDKSMRDHGLFQAICRTNRLDGEDKEFGQIVDYKAMFKQVEKAIAVYTSELDGHGEGDDAAVHMEDRLEQGKEKLETAREAWKLLVEEVGEPPRSDLDFLQYFCGNTENDTDLKDKAPMRVVMYKTVANYVRAFANLADDLAQAGFDAAATTEMQTEVDHAVHVRDFVRNAAGETLDLKPYEADMRFLIDRFIEAEKPRRISAFEDVPLVDLIVKTGIAEAIAEKFGQSGGRKDAIAEAIENNIRSTLIKEHLDDPAFYEKMSDLLSEVIEFRRENADRYEEYLAKIAELAAKISSASTAPGVPASIDTKGKRALFNNLEENELLALKIDFILRNECPEGFKGEPAREGIVKAKLYEVLNDVDLVERIFQIVMAQAEYG